jgi:NAD(P)H-hydrate repair Nnr-like enzyme with NAD(P)H-hydrate dehydratase domain
MGALMASSLEQSRNHPLTTKALAFYCACTAVWLHGKAAEALTADPRQAGTIGLTASELLPALRRCLNELTNDLAQS